MKHFSNLPQAISRQATCNLEVKAPQMVILQKVARVTYYYSWESNTVPCMAICCWNTNLVFGFPHLRKLYVNDLPQKGEHLLLPLPSCAAALTGLNLSSMILQQAVGGGRRDTVYSSMESDPVRISFFQWWWWLPGLDNTVSSHNILEEEVQAVHLLFTANHVVLHYSHINILSTWYYLCNAPPDITEADV